MNARIKRMWEKMLDTVVPVGLDALSLVVGPFLLLQDRRRGRKLAPAPKRWGQYPA